MTRRIIFPIPRSADDLLFFVSVVGGDVTSDAFATSNLPPPRSPVWTLVLSPPTLPAIRTGPRPSTCHCLGHPTCDGWRVKRKPRVKREPRASRRRRVPRSRSLPPKIASFCTYARGLINKRFRLTAVYIVTYIVIPMVLCCTSYIILRIMIV